MQGCLCVPSIPYEIKGAIELNNPIEQITSVIDLFKSGEIVNMTKTVYLESNGNKPSAKWSLSNRIIMYGQGTMDARGYNQWIKAHRHVKKGSKAIHILAPRLITKLNEDTQEKEKFIAGFCGLAVFRLEDTDGPPLVNVVKEPKIPRLAHIAKKLKVSIVFDNTQHGEHGSFNSRDSVIRLCTETEKTFFHELAHAVQLHLDGKLKAGQDTQQEVIAELTAATIAKMYGLDISESYEYIQSYVQGDSKNVGRQCLKVISKVEQILNYIFEVKEKKEDSKK